MRTQKSAVVEVPPAVLAATPAEVVLVLRTCNADLTSHGGFQWPASGMVDAPDWKPTVDCGNGLHGCLWGEGEGSLLNWAEDAKWLVCRVEASTIIDLAGKVKFPRAEVVFCGDRAGATGYIIANGAAGKRVHGCTATAGDRGTATAGDRGTATAGTGGVICILHWNGKRHKAKIAHVKDEDGDGDLEPNTPYRLNDKGEFAKVPA